MKFEIGRVAMNKAVGIVERALPNKDYGDATSGILLEAKGKTLTLTANSVEVFISTEVDLTKEVEKEGFVVPNGNILSNVVGNLKTLKKPIVFNYDDEKDELTINCEKYNGKLAHYPSEGFLTIPSLEEIQANDKMSIPARLIGDAVKKVAFARSNDNTHIQLTGIYIDQTEDNINLVATDSLRLSAIQYSSKVKNPKSVVVGYKYLDLLRKLLDDLEIDGGQILNLYVSADKIYFVHEESRTVIGLQTYGSEFIEGYEGFMIPQSECEMLFRLNRDHFLERLDLATSHNSSIQDEIIFAIKDGVGALKSSQTGGKLNDFDVPFDVQKVVKGEELEVKLVPQFLYNVLDVLKDKEVVIGLADVQEGPVTVYPIVEGNNISGEFVHVFSLT